MKLMQRFLGLLMALAMLFSLSAEAFAESNLLRLSGNGIAAAEDGSDPSEGDVPVSGNESAQPKDEINIVETEEPEGEIPIIDPELVAKEYGESRTLKATDDKTYSVQVDIGEKAGIPKGVELAVREILPGEAGYDAYVRQSAEALKEKLDNLALVRVFDISLRDPISGNEYQPNDKVKVSIRLLDARLGATEKLDVVHFGDEIETVRCALEGESVSFDTAGFSVYVVIGHEGDDTVVTPRVEFHFINSDFTDNNNGTYTASGYRFVNKHSEYQYTQILRNGEYLEMIDNPPNLVVEEYVPATSFDPAKTTYYTYDSATGVYTAVANPDAAELASYYEKTNAEKYFYGWYEVQVASGADNVNWKTGGAVDTAKPAKVTYSWPEDKKVEDETDFFITGPQKTVEENGVTKKVYLVNGVETAFGASETVPEGATPVYKGLNELRVGDTVTWTIGAATGTAVLDAEGTGHVYLVPAFQDFYFVNFHMGNKEATDALKKNLLTRRLVVFGTTDVATVRIGDIRCPSPDPEHRIFSGWETVKDDGVTTKVYYQTIDPDTGNERILTVDVDGTQTTSAGNGYFIKIRKDAVTGGSTAEVKTLDVYPVFAEARWLYYDVGSSGNGALYVAAAYRLTNDDSMGTAFQSLATSRRSGYTFGGWYVNAALVDDVIMNKDGQPYDLQVSETNKTIHYGPAIQLTDGDGNFVDAVKGKVFYTPVGTPADTATDQYFYLECASASSLPDGAVKLFEVTADGKLFMYKALDSLTVTANWVPAVVDYTIVYWLENANDDDYSLVGYDIFQALAGDRIKVSVSGANGRVMSIDASTGTDHDQTVTLQNTNENAKYYVKDLRFIHYNSYDGGNQGVEVKGDNSTLVNVYYDRDVYRLRFDIGFARRTSTNGSSTIYTAMTPAEAAAYNGTVYGSVNGQTITLTKDANGNWIYADAANGLPYGLVSGQYVPLTPGDATTTNYYKPQYRFDITTADGDDLYGIDANGDYVKLDMTEHSTTTTEDVDAYLLTSTLTAGKDYLIVNRNTNGSGYALGHNGETVARDAVTVVSGSPNYILATDVDDTSVWRVSGNTNNWKFNNSGYYIRRNNSENSLRITTSDSRNTWFWNGTNNYFYNNNYYLQYSNNTFSLGYYTQSSVYLYEKGTVQQSVTTTTYTYTLNGEAYTGDRYARTTNTAATEYTENQLVNRNGGWYLLDTAGTYGKANTYIPVAVSRTVTEVHDYYYNDALYDGTVYKFSAYTGTLYKQETMTGTWTYSVSNTTSPNYAADDNWETFLTNHRYDIGSTNPFGPGEYTGTYEITQSGTLYVVFYYDIVGKYGENILSKYPGSQPARNNGNYVFVGWLAQRDSYYTARLCTSIKGFFETITEDLILTGGTIPSRYNTKDENANPNNYRAITVDENNAYLQNLNIPEHQGVTQEFRCRYRGTSGYNYLYRIYLADVDTLAYPTEPTYKHIITAGSGSNPNLQTPPTYTGYTLESAMVLNDAGVPQTPGGSYSPYTVPELTAAGISGGMIMEFKLQPNEHTLTFRYVNETEPIGSATYNYGQSLSEANVYESTIAVAQQGYYFAGWYENPDGVGNKFNFNTTMPDNDIMLYAIYKPLQYLIKINPNGAEIDHIDHTGANYASFTNPTVTPLNRGQVSYVNEDSQTVVERTADAGYDKSRSNYFFTDYHETVGEYAVSRSHVPISDVAAEIYKGTGRHVYAYVNVQYLGGNVDGEWGVPSDLRNALYVDATYGLGQYKNGDPAQGETEIYQLYKFYHDYLAYEYNSRPGYWDCDGAHDLPFASWKALFMDKKDDGTPQLYRKCNAKESWVFLGWFDDDDGTGMPYDFTRPVEGPFTLTAHWRLDGGYKIQYTPEYFMPDSGDWINGEMRDGWIDPPVEQGGLSYTDGATTTVFKQPTNVTRNNEPVTDDSLIFRGWRIVSVSMGSNNTPIYTPLENGVYYDPGDSLTIDVQYADVNNIIHMQAVYEDKESSYRRPDITNLTLDANGGFLVTGTNGPRLNENRNLPWEGVGIILMDADADTIGFGNIQTSAAVHLYQYATDLTYPGGKTVYLMDDQGHYVDAEGHVVTEAERVEDPSKKLDPEGELYFENYWQDRNGQLQRYFLLGFDDRPDEGDYVATYPADSVVAVTRNDDQTIYAVWEPRIYLNVKNDTAIPDIGYEGGDVTFALSSTDMGTLEIVNEASGVYERIPLTNLTEITVHPGETLRISFPKGDDGSPVTLSGVNTLGPGMLLSAASSFDGSPRNPDPTGEFTNIKNTKPFDISDTLEIHDEGVVITFTSVRNPHTLVLDDNYAGGGQQEIYFSKTLDNVVYLNTPDATSYSLPSTSTRLGFEFVGWDPDQNWASNHNVETEYPAYNVNDWTIDSLTDFFTSDGSSEPDISLQHLYAVWKVNADATKVYVYKNVPDPGSQEKDFTFTVSFSGKYTYSLNMSTTSSEQSIPEMRVDVALHHGQYIRVTSTKHIGKAADAESEAIRSYVDILVEKFDPDGTPLNVVGNTKQHHMRWEWSQWDENVQNLRNITFTEQNLSVTETDYTGAYYDTDLEIAGTTTNFELTKASGRKVTWNETDAGGTVVFTNTRQTQDVVISKTLVSNSTAARTFEFKASYTLTENVNGHTDTTEKDLGSFTVTSGQSYTLEDIPVNAVVTVEELGRDLCDYETTVTVNGTAKSLAETVDGTGESRVYTRKVAFSLTNEPTTVNFTNSVKYYKVTFYKVDQNKQPGVEAFFKLSSSTDTLIPNVNTGVFYSTDRMYAGDYTLTETWVDSELYIGLNGPISLKLTGADNGKLIASPSVGDEAKVIVEGNAQSGFNVYVFNQRIIDFSITKVLDDVLLTTTRKFHFNVSYSYTMNGKTVNVIKQGSDAAHSVTESDGHGGTIVTVYEPAVELNGGQTVTLKIPVGATGLKVQEDTTRLANATDKMYETYDTTVVRTGSVGTVTIKNSEDVHPETDTADLPGAVYAAAIAVANNGDVITFTNKRKTVDVTISKTVIGDDKDGEFEFEIYVLNGRLPIVGYTVNETKNWVTDSSGLILLPDGVDEGDDPDPFTLHHYTSAADAKTITIPVGATITVEEKLTSAQETKGYAVFMTMPGRDIKLVDGRADKIELIGPTENQTIRVFNIPSICKVTDADGNLLYVLQEGSEATNDAIYIPAIFPTIKGAFEGRDGGIGGLGNYYGKQDDGSYNHYTDTSLERQYQIQMLVDYEVPNTDVVNVNPGYNLIFTTADRNATDGYPFRSPRPFAGAPDGASAAADDYRAVLTRQPGATAAFFTVSNKNASNKTIFKMADLIIDGHGADLDSTVRGGCLTAYHADVEIDNCVIYRFNAKQGGAVYTYGYSVDESLTVNDTIFDSCNSYLGNDGNGGGAINTNVKTVTITGHRDPVTGESTTVFKNCSAIHQGGAICYMGVDYTVGNKPVIQDTNLTVTDCDFIDCVSRAGGAIEADVKTINLSGSKFVRCRAQNMPGNVAGTNGGAVNNYYNNGKDPGSTSMTVTDCSFEGCTAENGNGGGLRSKAAMTTLTDCTFTDSGTTVCSAKNGGGAAFDRGGSATIVINGGTFTNCKASESGGGIYSTGKLTIHDGTDATVITACSAKNGGGIHTSANTTLEGGTSINGCYATTNGGAIYNGSGTLTVRGNTVIDGDQSLPAAASAKNAASGGAIYCNSTLAVTGNTIIRDCVATSGGAIYVNSGKTASLAGTAQIIGHDSLDTGLETETANATEGGAIYVNNATLNMTAGTPKIQSCVAGLGGAIFAKGSETNITVSVGEISGNKATSYGGGAIRVEEGAKVTISGGTISGNHVDGNVEKCGGAIGIKQGTVTIKGGTISGNYAKGSGAGTDKAVQGGAIFVDSRDTAILNIEGGTITGNYVEATSSGGYAYGGAINVKAYGVVNISGGTISGNTATAETTANAKGAGIYLAQGATLNISGNPSFGGDGIANAETGALDNSSGNLLQTALPDGSKNGGQTYTYARQDIYLAGYASDKAGSINVTGSLSSGKGAIWVWAEEPLHIHRADQFAIHAGAGVSEASLSAFRNARVDGDTGTTGAALYGVKSTKDGEADYVIWGYVGGTDVSFIKRDGYGELLNGASFTLYTNAACTTALQIGGTDATATSTTVEGEAGTVLFQRVPAGVYYMKETGTVTDANGITWANTNTYVVLVGSANLTVPTQPTDGDWSATGVLGKLTQNDIKKQTGNGTLNYAIFLVENGQAVAVPLKLDAATGEPIVDTDTGELIATLKLDNATGIVTAAPDITAVGIMNTSTASRPVILSKINSALQPLPGGQFTILRADRTVVATGLTSDESGVYFVGQLPYGTYYVLETKQPGGYQLPRYYFVFTISADGVKNEGAKSTNTLRASTNDDYKVNP